MKMIGLSLICVPLARQGLGFPKRRKGDTYLKGDTYFFAKKYVSPIREKVRVPNSRKSTCPHSSSRKSTCPQFAPIRRPPPAAAWPTAQVQPARAKAQGPFNVPAPPASQGIPDEISHDRRSGGGRPDRAARRAAARRRSLRPSRARRARLRRADAAFDPGR